MLAGNVPCGIITRTFTKAIRHQALAQELNRVCGHSGWRFLRTELVNFAQRGQAVTIQRSVAFTPLHRQSYSGMMLNPKTKPLPRHRGDQKNEKSRLSVHGQCHWQNSPPAETGLPNWPGCPGKFCTAHSFGRDFVVAGVAQRIPAEAWNISSMPQVDRPIFHRSFDIPT
jgi:hypothetical protein